MSNISLKATLTDKQRMIADQEYNDKKMNKTAAFVLWWLLGAFGGHRFYMKDTGLAVAMLLLGWMTLFIWPLVDVFFISKGIDRKNDELEKGIIEKVKAFS